MLTIRIFRITNRACTCTNTFYLLYIYSLSVVVKTSISTIFQKKTILHGSGVDTEKGAKSFHTSKILFMLYFKMLKLLIANSNACYIKVYAKFRILNIIMILRYTIRTRVNVYKM